MSQLVVDLSHHNTIPKDLKEAKAFGVAGIIHKCTESTGYVDDKCKARWSLATNAGLLWGTYHFLRPGKIEDQVSHYLKNAAPVSDENSLLCCDYEDEKIPLHDVAKFMRMIDEETGMSPVLYSGHVLREKCQKEDPEDLVNYRLWMAQYGPEVDLPVGWDMYWLWQYTDQGEVPGINPPTDLNRYEGELADLTSEWTGSREPISPPEPIPPAEDLVVNVEVFVDAPPGVKVDVKVTNA